jgi:uncharacterized protein YndB with AHSA1/START domain
MSVANHSIEFKGQSSISIEVPIETVYPYLVDFQRHPEWVQNISKVTKLSPGPIDVGTVFRTEEGPPPVPLGTRLKMMVHFMSGVFSGAKTYSNATITALEPNRRIAWEAGVPKGEDFLSFAEWEFIFEAQGNSTRLTQHFHYTPPDPKGQRMIGAAGTEGLVRACAVNLERLKLRLEERSNGKH